MEVTDKEPDTLSKPLQFDRDPDRSFESIKSDKRHKRDDLLVWLTIIPSFINFFVVDGIGYSLSLYFVAWTHSFEGEPKSRISAVSAIHFSVTLIGGPVASQIVDSLGCGRANLIGGTLAASGFFICSLPGAANVYVLMIFVGLVSGMGVAIVYLASYKSIILHFDRRKEIATGIFSCGSGIGALVMGPAVDFMIKKYGWQGSFLILSGLFMQTLICGCLFILFDTLSLGRRRRGACANDSNKPLELPMPQPTNVVTPIEVDNTPSSDLKTASEEESLNRSRNLNNMNKSCSMPHFGYYSLLRINNSNPSSPTDSNDNLQTTVHRNDSRNSLTTLNTLKTKVLAFAKNSNFNKSMSASFLSPTTPHVPDATTTKTKAHLLSPNGETICLTGKRNSITSSKVACSTSFPYARTTNAWWISYKLKRCRHKIWRELVKRFQFFRSFKFTVFFVSNLILYASGDVPCLFTIDRAAKMEVGDTGILISIMGFSNTIGHIAYGIMSQKISDKAIGGPEGKRGNNYLYCASILLCGIATICFPFAHSWSGVVALVFSLGFLLSSNYTLTSILTYNISPKPQTDTFATAFGLILTAQGVGALIGAPIGGAIIDYYGNYDLAFYLAGIFICLSGLLLLLKTFHSSKHPT